MDNYIVILTDIIDIPRNKKRKKIFVDNEYFSNLTLQIIEKYNLIIGAEIQYSKLIEIMLDSEKNIAKEKLFNYLSKSMKTKNEAVIYLKKAGFHNKVIAYAVDIALSYRFLDDKKYCEIYIDCNKENKGIRRIRQELSTKGIDKELINEVFDNIEIDEYQSAIKIAEKFIVKKQNDSKIREKTIRYMMSKGFNWSIIEQVIKECNING